MKNYQARFSTVLSAEELQMELDMREFDLERVTCQLHSKNPHKEQVDLEIWSTNYHIHKNKFSLKNGKMFL